MDNNLRDILSKQKQSTDLLETEIKRLEGIDLAKRNQSLEKEVEKLSAELETLRARVNELGANNAGLQNALHSRLFSEKLAVLDNSQKKAELFFSDGLSEEYNRLTDLENRFKGIMGAKLRELRGSHDMLSEELHAKITSRFNDLAQEITADIAAARTGFADTSAVSEKMRTDYDALRAEEISEREIREITKKSSFERILGLNVINKIGILLILIGVIAASQYTYTRLGEVGKGILLFALGLAMVGLGEFLSRKKANVFSLGMSAGGVAVNYAALTLSYFSLEILSVYPAALLCVVITAGAFFLSVRHSSQVIATFSVIGGFLPLLTVSGSLNYGLTFSAMAYFVILGGFALGLSFKKKWIVTAFFGLIMNIIATVYVLSFFDRHEPVWSKVVLISYITVSFIIYTLIPVIGTYSERLKFKKSDVTLIAINTFFSSLIIYQALNVLGIAGYDGLIAVVFMLCYVGLGWFVKTKISSAHDMKMLFFITAITFFILITPLQFDVIWLTLGWLVQGTALMIYGILKERRRFAVSGIVIGSLCLLSFLFFDFMNPYPEHFELKYFSVTLCALLVLSVFAYKHINSKSVRTFKYFSVINLWFFLMYIINRAFDEFVSGGGKISTDYLLVSSIVVVTLALAFAVRRIKPLRDRGMVVISHALYIIGMFMMLFQNGTESPLLRTDTEPLSIQIAASALLITINFLTVLAFADMLHYFTRRGSMRAEWLPFLTSGYFTILLTQNLIVYYNMSFAGMTLSLIYAGLALAWCIFGFWKRFAFMRRFGLAFALMAVAKVFLIDLWSLTEGYRIITFFALGITLVGISFVYQYFTRRIESLENTEK